MSAAPKTSGPSLRNSKRRRMLYRSCWKTEPRRFLKLAAPLELRARAPTEQSRIRGLPHLDGKAVAAHAVLGHFVQDGVGFPDYLQWHVLMGINYGCEIVACFMLSKLGFFSIAEMPGGMPFAIQCSGQGIFREAWPGRHRRRRKHRLHCACLLSRERACRNCSAQR